MENEQESYYKKRIAELEENLKQKDEDQRMFSKMFLHELGNSLNGIYGFSTLMKDEAEDEYSREIFSLIYSNSQKMLKLSNLLNITSLSKDSLLNETKKINSEDFLKNETNCNESYLKNKNIKFYTNTNTELFYAPKILMEFIDSTLTGNALSWTQNNETISKYLTQDEKNITYTIENPISKKRTEYQHGLKEGLGLKATEKIAKNLDGKFETYKAHNIQTKKEIFGAEFTIPRNKGLEDKI